MDPGKHWQTRTWVLGELRLISSMINNLVLLSEDIIKDEIVLHQPVYESRTFTHMSTEENSLELSQPGVGHDGPEDGGEVAEGHEGVVDGGGQVIVPSQEVFEIQHEYSCVEKRSTQRWMWVLMAVFSILSSTCKAPASSLKYLR